MSSEPQGQETDCGLSWLPHSPQRRLPLPLGARCGLCLQQQHRPALARLWRHGRRHPPLRSLRRQWHGAQQPGRVQRCGGVGGVCLSLAAFSPLLGHVWHAAISNCDMLNPIPPSRPARITRPSVRVVPMSCLSRAYVFPFFPPAGHTDSTHPFYHYHVTAGLAAPYTITCLKGCVFSNQVHVLRPMSSAWPSAELRSSKMLGPGLPYHPHACPHFNLEPYTFKIALCRATLC